MARNLSDSGSDLSQNTSNISDRSNKNPSSVQPSMNTPVNDSNKKSKLIESPLYGYRTLESGETLYLDRDPYAKSKSNWDDFGIEQLMADKNQDIFRNGLKYDFGQTDPNTYKPLFPFLDSVYEDPIYWGFTIDVDALDGKGDLSDISKDKDSTSPFFRKGIYNKGIGEFIDRYGKFVDEIGQRSIIYKRFYELMIEMFRSNENGWNIDAGESNGRPWRKNHYIYSVKGLDILKKRGMTSSLKGKSEENSLEFMMHDDCKMTASYLAYLYNSLTWSNHNQKLLIPSNLLKFKMFLKFSEIRNMTSIRNILLEYVKSQDKSTFNEAAAVNHIKRNISCVIYTFHNCEFNFKDSFSWNDEIKIGGWGGDSYERSNGMSFKIQFDSFSKRIRPTMLDPGIEFDDNFKNMGLEEQVNATPDVGTAGNPDTQIPNESSRPPRNLISISNKNYRLINYDKSFYRDDLNGAYNNGTENPNADRSHVRKENQQIMDNILIKQPSMNEDRDTSSKKSKEEGLVKNLIGSIKQNSTKNNPNDNNNPSSYQRFVTSLREDSRRRQDDIRGEVRNNMNPTLTDSTGKVKVNPNFISNKIKNVLEQRFEQFIQDIKIRVNQERAELISKLIREVRVKSGVKKINPSNIYHHEGLLQKYLNAIKGDIGYDITSFLQRSLNKGLTL